MALTGLFYFVLVCALTLAEYEQTRLGQILLKPLAALGFILIAFMSGAWNSDYGQMIVFGLIACAAGDVLLLSRKSPKLFMAGMAAFAVGHLAYTVAFLPFQDSVFDGIEIGLISGACIGALAAYLWLKDRIPDNMQIAVPIYILVILVMMISAAGLPRLGFWGLATLGAVMFAVSDVFVARDRFVAPNPKNALAITPLYFGAQAFIALSTQAAF